MSWDDADHSSSDNTAGGCERPPTEVICPHCAARRDIKNMTIEANERSPLYGYYVCNEPWQQGGCYEGPYPDLEKPAKSDRIGPLPNIYNS